MLLCFSDFFSVLGFLQAKVTQFSYNFFKKITDYIEFTGYQLEKKCEEKGNYNDDLILETPFFANLTTHC